MADSLLELLIQRPSAAERFMSVLPMLKSNTLFSGLPSSIDPDATGSYLNGDVPPGRGIFFNNQVDVLQQNDPRLITRRGVTLARPAMHSLIDILKKVGYKGDAGGGYRTASQQAGMNPALAAPVGQSYHQEGIAIDLAAALQNARVERLLSQAGWNRFSPSGEPWHWSFGVTG